MFNIYSNIFQKGGGEDFDDMLDELGGLGKWGTLLKQEYIEFAKYGKFEIEFYDRKIPKATSLPDSWPTLPFQSLSNSSSGSTSHR